MKTTGMLLVLAAVTACGCSSATQGGSEPSVASQPSVTGSVADLVGTYSIDLARSRPKNSVVHESVRRKIRLTVNPDKSIVYGAGKITRYELLSDFDAQGKARLVSRVMIGGKTHESHCILTLHPDGFVEIHGDFFKVK